MFRLLGFMKRALAVVIVALLAVGMVAMLFPAFVAGTR
jgi:hypothetical protein